MLKKALFVAAVFLFLVFRAATLQAGFLDNPNYEGPFVVREIIKDTAEHFIKLTVVDENINRWYVIVYRDSYLERFTVMEKIRIRIKKAADGFFDASFFKENAPEDEQGWVCCFEVRSLAAIN